MNDPLNHDNSSIGAFAWMIRCVLILGSMLSLPAIAAEAGNSVDTFYKADAGRRFAVVKRIHGEVTVTAASSGSMRTLSEGSPVYVGDYLRATSSGEALLRTDDAGFIGIRSGTEFIAENFAAEGKKSDHFALRLIKGSFRVVTGWIGRLNRAEHRVITPTVTIGVRGTDHEPYVLDAEQAAATPYKEGTYDKVNRGKTTLGEGEQTLEIGAGKVGFARAPTLQAKGLMTILMPVLLEKVPDFYVPGKFDAELDLLSRSNDADSLMQLRKKRKADMDNCDSAKIARNWLQRFDRAVLERAPQSIISLFSPDIAVRAMVRNSNGELIAVDIGRDELAQSTVAAVKGLKNYHQRRLTLDAHEVVQEGVRSCSRINVRSDVIESGLQSGRPYRLESSEEYVLELRAKKWLAVKAVTTQK